MCVCVCVVSWGWLARHTRSSYPAWVAASLCQLQVDRRCISVRPTIRARGPGPDSPEPALPIPAKPLPRVQHTVVIHADCLSPTEPIPPLRLNFRDQNACHVENSQSKSQPTTRIWGATSYAPHAPSPPRLLVDSQVKLLQHQRRADARAARRAALPSRAFPP
jgi:hypothetical protein